MASRNVKEGQTGETVIVSEGTGSFNCWFVAGSST